MYVSHIRIMAMLHKGFLRDRQNDWIIHLYLTSFRQISYLKIIVIKACWLNPQLLIKLKKSYLCLIFICDVFYRNFNSMWLQETYMVEKKTVPSSWYIYIYMCVCVCVCEEYHHHQHYVVPLARISQTLSRLFSLSFIASGRSSGLHPVSSHSCWMYVRAGRPAFARPYVGGHRSTSLIS